MAIDIIMPQMGESVAEGTIVRWLKKVGDTVDRDEPIYEITTDKVDAEIPSPEAGVLIEIRVPAGKTVEVGAVVGQIGAAGEKGASASAAASASSAAQLDGGGGAGASLAGDVEIVMDYAGVSRELAVAALNYCGGDIVSACMSFFT